jgi:mono/diheme cytochrome c family protein
MARDQATSELNDPWPKVGWAMVVGTIVVSAILGFGILSRYQQDAPTLDLWNAICRGLGISADTGPATQPAPALRTPTRVAWTSATLAQIAAGDAQHGAFIALNCTACHGPGGVSASTLIPTLAGMDVAVIYK